jgi:hypothetical protein
MVAWRHAEQDGVNTRSMATVWSTHSATAVECTASSGPPRCNDDYG